MNVDSFDELASRAEDPASPFYVEILRAETQLLRERPDGVSYLSIASVAWASLTPEQRREQRPYLLELYARTVCDQRRQREDQERLDRDAANPATSYLSDLDVAVLWDAVMDGRTESTECDRSALLNVLCELELLQHRIAMRDNELDHR